MTDLAREIDLLRDAIGEMAERHELELDAARKVAREALIDKRIAREELRRVRARLDEALWALRTISTKSKNGWSSNYARYSLQRIDESGLPPSATDHPNAVPETPCSECGCVYGAHREHCPIGKNN